MYGSRITAPWRGRCMTMCVSSRCPVSVRGNTLSSHWTAPHELAKWVLYTERYGYDAPEFCSGNAWDMGQYINSMAAELEQGIQPAFLLEKRAVSKYIFRHEGEHGIPVYRDREHGIQLHLPERPSAAEGNGHGQHGGPASRLWRGTGGATREAVCVGVEPPSQKGPLSGRKLVQRRGQER